MELSWKKHGERVFIQPRPGEFLRVTPATRGEYVRVGKVRTGGGNKTWREMIGPMMSTRIKRGKKINFNIMKL